MKKFLAYLAVAAMAMTVTACSNNGTENQDQSDAGGKKDAIVVGGLAPLTGSAAVYGKTTKQGTELAFAEINSKGGVLGKQIDYKILDEKGDASEAVNAFNRLLDENAVAIIGDITSKPAAAVAQEAAANGIPNITPTATAMSVTQAGDNIFRVCYTDPYQGETMAKFAKDTLEAKTVAIMHNTSNDYSDGISKAFKAEAEKNGITIVADEGYGQDDTDFKTQLTNIAQKNPDVLLLPDYYDKIALIVPQAREVGVDATFIGADGWDGVLDSIDEGNMDAVAGSFFCNHYSIMDENKKVQDFISAYREKYNAEPSAFSALGYDAAYILADAIERAGSTEWEEINKALADTNYEGVTGKLTFDEDGNPIKAITVMTIKDGKYIFDSRVEPETMK